MGTRGIVAVQAGDGFKGAYNNWDSYPEELGAWLYHYLKTETPTQVRVFLASVKRGSFRTFFDQGSDNGKLTWADIDPLFHEWIYVIAPNGQSFTVLKPSYHTPCVVGLLTTVWIAKDAPDWEQIGNLGTAWRQARMAEFGDDMTQYKRGDTRAMPLVTVDPSKLLQGVSR